MEKAQRITISMLPSLWHAFRVFCVQRKTSGSKEIQQFVASRLAAWETAPHKETEHTLIFDQHDMQTLQAFHRACHARGLSASIEVEAFMRQQLTVWQQPQQPSPPERQ